MKKTLIKILIPVMLVMSLCGCGQDYMPDITDDELARVEEYAVQLLLKYHSGYHADYLSAEEAAEKEAKIYQKAELQAEVKANKEAAASANQAKQEASKDKDGDDSKVQAPVYTDIDEFLTLTDVDIDYQGYDICSSYPTNLGENDFQGVVNATSGNSLLVINYSITNKTSADYFFDVPSLGMKAAFKLGESKTKVPLTTMLLDDLFNTKEIIPAGASVNKVLLVELNSSDAENITDITMILKANGNKMELSL